MNNQLKNTLNLLAVVLIIGGLVLIGIYIYRKKSHVYPKTTNINNESQSQKKEKFYVIDENCDCSGLSIYAQYKSIISVESGTILSIEYSSVSTATEHYYSIKFTNPSNNMDEYLMVDSTSGTPTLTVGANNIDGSNGSEAQLWKIEEVPSSNITTTTTSTTTSTSTSTSTSTKPSTLTTDKKYYLVSKIAPDYVLQHQFGTLNIRAKDKYTSQYWVLSTNIYTSGVNIPNEYVNIQHNSSNNKLLNSNRYDSNNNNNINAANQQKLDNVLQLITNSLQQLNNNVKSSSSTSSFGYSMENPIKINLTMDNNGVNASCSGSSVEAFTNTNDLNNNVLNLLDKYENSSSSNNSIDALTELIAKNGGCQSIDLRNYTNKRVGQCNCNLTK